MMNIRSLLRLAVLVTSSVWFVPAHGADEKPFTGELEMILNGAIYHGSNQAPDSPCLILDLEAKDGKWEPVWGYGMSFVHNASNGRVMEGELSGDTLRLKIAMRIGGDIWIAGGRARYDVQLRRGPDGTYTGTYTGAFRDSPAFGKATATLKPPRPPIPADFVPVQPGEHPRVLFRKKDLPELRKKFNTPFGKQFEAVSRAGSDPVALGVLYQLTGHKDYAMDALPFVRETMLKQDPGFMGLGQDWGPRMRDVAITYDLCYDAWPENVRKMVDGYLMWMTDRCLRFMSSLSTAANTHPCSNFSGPMRGGGAIASLVIWGEKAPEPQAPHDAGNEAVVIPPLKDFAPVKGVPIYIFRSDDRPAKWRQGAPLIQRPTDWVWSDPLPFVAKEDVLAAVGGYAKALPVPGMTVTVQRTAEKGTNETQSILFHRPDEVFAVPEVVEERLTPAEVKDLKIRSYFEDVSQPDKTSLLFCYLRVPAAQLLRFSKDQSGTRAWMNGVEIFGDDVIRVQDGVYSLLIQHHGEAPTEGFSAEFVPVSEEDVQRTMADRRVRYKKAFDDYQDDLVAWKVSGGLDPKREYLFGLGREEMNMVYRVMMGNGGFQTEGEKYTFHSADCPLQYAVAYRKMFGRDVTPYPRITHFPPRYVAQAIFPGDQAAISGKAMVLPVNGPGWNVPVGWLSVGFPIVPEQLKPGVLWAWNRLTGVNPAGVADGSGFTGSTLFGDHLRALPYYTFLHYPLDLQPKHPSESFENTWAADTKGLYIFRNGWKGDDDIVLQVFLKNQINKGHNQASAGTFTLYGLGQTWVESPPDRDCPRWKQSVVMFPEDEDNMLDWETGVTTYSRQEKDGSGAVSVNLDFIYSGGRIVRTNGVPVLGKNGKPQRLPVNDQNGIHLPENVEPDGVKGMRAFGVDYSGKCGAPMLLVVVDKITGGGERIWLRNGAGGEGSGQRTSIRSEGSASLATTFVVPAVASQGSGTIKYTETKTISTNIYGRTKTMVHATTNAVSVGGIKGTDHFFAIMTLQRGPAPKVTIEGQGLDAKVTVGARKVSFDGQKVVFSDP